MTFTITEKQLRIGIAAVVAVVLAAICVWVLLPSKNVADACVATGRTASGELIYPVNCNGPTITSGISAPYQSGMANQVTTQPNNQPSADLQCRQRGGLLVNGVCKMLANISESECKPAGGIWFANGGGCGGRALSKQECFDSSVWSAELNACVERRNNNAAASRPPRRCNLRGTVYLTKYGACMDAAPDSPAGRCGAQGGYLDGDICRAY